MGYVDSTSSDESSTSSLINGCSTTPTLNVNNENNGDSETESSETDTSLRIGGKQNTLIYHKYYNPSKYKQKADRPVTVLNNLSDVNISQKRIGGHYNYNTNKINEIQILRTLAAFDRSLVQLHLSIPQIYTTDPVQFIIEQKKTVNSNS